MRTNIDIDDDLLRRAIVASGARTKREAVLLGLAALVERRDQRRILELKGIGWEGDLDAMRSDR